MLELRTDHFILFALGVNDEQELARAGSLDTVIEIAGGGRYTGTFRTLTDLEGHLQVYLPVTDTVVVRELTPDALLSAVDDLLSGGVLDEVFPEVLGLEVLGLEVLGEVQER